MILVDSISVRRCVMAAIASAGIFLALALSSALPWAGAHPSPATSGTPAPPPAGCLDPSPEEQGFGFLLDKGVFTHIDFPGAALTAAAGINNRGRIVGGHIDADGTDHGLLLDQGVFTTFRHQRRRADCRRLRPRGRKPAQFSAS